jgi:hypothetical protein
MVGFDINCLLFQYILLVRDICEKYQLRSKVEDNTKYFKTSKRVVFCYCFSTIYENERVIIFSELSIKVITKLPNSEQSYKGKVKTHNYINRQNQSTTGKL